jgi:mannose-6-phosphate isomerase-like protein (cupin superfamily)
MTAQAESELRSRMSSFVGLHTSKVPDWDAFPPSRGFPELDRAQIRYVGSGASPKSENVDTGTLRPEHFTVSMIQQPVGKYAASHAHEAEEAFFVLEGILTVGWVWDETVIMARLGPRDMIVHARERPHGFKNEGFEPVLCSIMHAKARPLPPRYTFHPKTHDPALSERFGGAPGEAYVLDFDSKDERHQEMARHVVRYSQQKPQWNKAGFARMPYIGETGAPATSFRKDLLTLPKGVAIQAYQREVEDTYLVLQGCIAVGWEEGGTVVEKRLGPKDLIFNPAGQRHYFRNDGVEDAQFLMVVGTEKPEDVYFQAA